ncbi:GAF and ANTAR domain-containing protein [Cryobacterium sp. N22]|uniref:GAF and ANTAR domain-containing protein n=1 Tax=Cryobacterium sp. N22 TaxID=2048290 RepID=UPI000CE3D449|nr:GAF and ANTAR domain-containing protein [Cryobacterium sp. N22]
MHAPVDEKGFVQFFVALADTLNSGHDVLDSLDLLVQGSTTFTSASEAGILLADRTGKFHVAASTSERSSAIEEAQLGFEEGPSVEAVRTGRTVEAPDIERTSGKWPAFSTIAAARGFRAAHAVPLRAGGDIIGGLNLFSTLPGALSHRDEALAEALASFATNSIEQYRRLQDHGTLREQLQGILEGRVLIEQAKGVLAQRHGVAMEEAFSLLRARARMTDKQLRDVAEGIVNQARQP